MGLKLADDEKNNKPEGGLRLSGVEDSQAEMDRRTEEQNPWDFDQPEEPIRMYSVSNRMDLSSAAEQKDNGGSIILVITKIIVYVLFAFEIASIAWICTQDLSDLFINLLKFQGLYSICTLACIVDAILVNILYERKISLIILAWMFNILYPALRNRHIKGNSGMGALCGWGMGIALLALVGIMTKAFTSYGSVFMITDEATRKEAVAVMDQILEDGSRLGDKLLEKISVQGAAVEQQGNTTAVAFTGGGGIYLDGGAFVDTGGNSIETQLAFVKSSGGETYELGAVVLNGSTLNAYGVSSYWKSVILD